MLIFTDFYINLVKILNKKCALWSSGDLWDNKIMPILLRCSNVYFQHVYVHFKYYFLIKFYYQFGQTVQCFS